MTIKRKKDNKSEGKKDGDKKLPPWKTPPAPQAPHQRQYKGAWEYWCDKCKRWNKHHKTAQLRTRAELQAAQGNASTIGGPANGDVPATTTAAPLSGATVDPPPSTGSGNAAFLMNGFCG